MSRSWDWNRHWNLSVNEEGIELIKHKLVFMAFLVMLGGCGTFKLEGPPGPNIKNYYQLERDFLSTAELTIKDEQYALLTSPLKVQTFKNSTTGIKSSNLSVYLALEKCVVTKRFWQTPYNLFTALILTFGQVYECKTKVTVTDYEKSASKVFETKTSEFAFVGLGGILMGPFMVPNLVWNKVERASRTIYLYMEESGRIPVQSSTP